MAETSRGEVSEDTLTFLGSLKETIEVCDLEKSVLFARNADVTAYNLMALNKLPGVQRLYTSIDTGPGELLRACQAPKVCCIFYFYFI